MKREKVEIQNYYYFMCLFIYLLGLPMFFLKKAYYITENKMCCMDKKARKKTWHVNKNIQEVMRKNIWVHLKKFEYAKRSARSYAFHILNQTYQKCMES